jgi:hypothetical protein
MARSSRSFPLWPPRGRQRWNERRCARRPLDRVGQNYATVDPGKIVAIVETNQASSCPPPCPVDATSHKTAEHLVRFLLEEQAAGRLPRELPPLQSGVGNIGNGVMAGLGEHTDIPPFTMYTEVFQDSCVARARPPRCERMHGAGCSRSRLERLPMRLSSLIRMTKRKSSRGAHRATKQYRGGRAAAHLGLLPPERPATAGRPGVAMTRGIAVQRGRKLL